MGTVVAKRFKAIDLDLRSGRIDSVRVQLRDLAREKLTSKDRVTLGGLCFRANLPELGMRQLEPIVRTPNGEWNWNEPEALLYYGALMQRAGSLTEAQAVLSGLNPAEQIKANLYLAFCRFNQWDYNGAIPLLNAYTNAEADPYSRLVGEVNLASALVYSGQGGAGRELLLRLERELPHVNFRLRANVNELLATEALQEGRLEDVERWISQAERLLPAGHLTQDSHFVLKARAILAALKSESLEPLLQFQALARAGRFWESVRETDLFAIKISPDEERLSRLWFGTPHLGFRTRIRQIIGREPAQQHHLIGGSGAQCTLNLRDGAVSGHKASISGTTLAVLRALFSDLYNPQRPRTLFSRLYPGEHFNPFTSPERVKHAILRARRTLAAQGIDLPIAVNHGRLFATPPKSLQVRIEDLGSAPGPKDHLLARLEAVFASGESFPAAEGARVLGLSLSTFKRLARNAIDAGQMKRFGRARYTRYRFVSN